MILRRDQPSHHSYSPGGSTELGYTPIAEKEGIKNYQNSRKSTGGKRNRNNSKNSKNVFQGMERRFVQPCGMEKEEQYRQSVSNIYWLWI